jgi:enoyl-CoA hydratase/carnithine racemase
MSISATIEGGILDLVIDRPDKRNALTRSMYAALADALVAAAGDGAVRAVLIRGTGAGFCAGNDIGDFQTSVPSEGISHTTRFLHAISTHPKPIVAAVQGNAVGIGTTMLLHCDIIIAGAGAHFSLPFANLGVVPEAASSLLLPRMIGTRRAARMFLLGEPVPAATALDWGLVTDVVADAELLATARGYATRLAGMAPAALAHTKALMKSSTTDVHERMAEEGKIFAAQLRSAEAKEAFAAFMEKRKPDFSSLVAPL